MSKSVAWSLDGKRLYLSDDVEQFYLLEIKFDDGNLSKEKKIEMLEAVVNVVNNSTPSKG